METTDQLRRREESALAEARELARRAGEGDADAREELEAAAAFLSRAQERADPLGDLRAGHLFKFGGRS